MKEASLIGPVVSASILIILQTRCFIEVILDLRKSLLFIQRGILGRF